MSLNPQQSASTNKPRPVIPPGTYIARNYAVIDLGTQMESYMGQEPKASHKVILIFEIPKFMHVFEEEKGPQPLVVSQEYTFIASDKSKLAKVMKAWGSLKEMPKTLNLKKYLGKYCTVTVENKEVTKNGNTNTYSSIADGGRSISPVMEEMKGSLPQACNPDVWLEMDMNTPFDWATFGKIPKWIQEKMKKSQEWSGITTKYPQPSATGQVATSGGNGTVVTADEDDPSF